MYYYGNYENIFVNWISFSGNTIKYKYVTWAQQ